MSNDLLRQLEDRLGTERARQRLKVEADHKAQVFGQGLTFFHLENWYSAASVVRTALQLTGLYRRARREADDVTLRQNCLTLNNLPASFIDFAILHISDLHVDLSRMAMDRMLDIIATIQFDICVLTGDYRGRTYGPFAAAMDGVARIRQKIPQRPIYAVLGNHDSIEMVPGMEALGIRVLLNESETLIRGGQSIYLAGIDDAHFYRADDIGAAASGIPKDSFSILLSHTPEVYHRAAQAGFDLMLSGHTHGGQLCLPGSIPIKLEAKLPRKMGAGAWEHLSMKGYTSTGVGTSILPVRLNCPPEVTLHILHRG